MSHWILNKQGTLRSGWKALGFFLLVMVLGTIAALILQGRGQSHGLGPWSGAVLGAAASFLCVRLEGRSFRGLGFRPGRAWLLECLAGILGGILIIGMSALLAWSLGGLHWEWTAGLGTRGTLVSTWVLLGVAFNEELLCRGFPFQRLVEGAGPWVGQLVFAGLFALLHWGNPGMQGATKAWATLNIGLSAILFGFCCLRTRSLAMPIGLHLGWNWAQGSLLGFAVSGTTDIKDLWTPVFHHRPDWVTGGAFGLEASLPCALVCGAAILAAWRWKGPAASADASTASAS